MRMKPLMKINTFMRPIKLSVCRFSARIKITYVGLPNFFFVEATKLWVNQLCLKVLETRGKEFNFKKLSFYFLISNKFIKPNRFLIKKVKKKNFQVRLSITFEQGVRNYVGQNLVWGKLKIKIMFKTTEKSFGCILVLKNVVFSANIFLRVTF